MAVKSTAKRRSASAKTSTERPLPTKRRLPRAAKGKRASFHDTDGVDELFAIAVALTAEISALGERLRTLEAVLEKARRIAPQAVEKHALSAPELAARVAWREALIERVFQVLEVSVAPKRQR